MDIYLLCPVSIAAYRREFMSTLLKIDVSPRGEHSISRKLSSHFATEWQSNHVGSKIVSRDLATTKIPYVDLPWIAGAFSAPGDGGRLRTRIVCDSVWPPTLRLTLTGISSEVTPSWEMNSGRNGITSVKPV